MAKKNVTIVLEEEVIERLRQLPQVRESSLSSYLADVLIQQDKAAREESVKRLRESFAMADKIKTKPWKWNREEIYEERIGRPSKVELPDENAG